MASEEMDYTFIIDLIETGHLDGIIDILVDAGVDRRKFLQEMRGATNRALMMPGTKVRVFNIRPKYLAGIQGTVSAATASRRGDIMVDIDPLYYHRLGHRYGKQLSIPASSLEEIA